MQIYFDEAGRGPLFWPLYIGLVVSKLSSKALANYDLFQDSKKLSSHKRELAFQLIKTLEQQGQLFTALWSVDAETIDRYGVTRAINLAVCKGLYQLLASLLGEKVSAKFFLDDLKQLITRYETEHEKIILILDGKSDFWLWKELKIQTETVIHGDTNLKEIAIASILAKVSRDQTLDIFAERYPDYWFEQHKGYGTKAHYAAIEQFWVLKEHRKLFLKKSFPNRKLESFDFNALLVSEDFPCFS